VKVASEPNALLAVNDVNKRCHPGARLRADRDAVRICVVHNADAGLLDRYVQSSKMVHAARLGNLIGWLRAEKPAVVALQELKAVDREFPKAAIEKAGRVARPKDLERRPGDPDVGVPANDSPMDFSAWFEAYLGGRWYTFDARYNMPRIGRILMARGRDATDVAIVTSREFQGEDRRGRVKPTVMLWTHLGCRACSWSSSDHGGGNGGRAYNWTGRLDRSYRRSPDRGLLLPAASSIAAITMSVAVGWTMWPTPGTRRSVL
jgi:hypothetical protein